MQIRQAWTQKAQPPSETTTHRPHAKSSRRGQLPSQGLPGLPCNHPWLCLGNHTLGFCLEPDFSNATVVLDRSCGNWPSIDHTALGEASFRNWCPWWSIKGVGLYVGGVRISKGLMRAQMRNWHSFQPPCTNHLLRHRNLSWMGFTCIEPWPLALPAKIRITRVWVNHTHGEHYQSVIHWESWSRLWANRGHIVL